MVTYVRDNTGRFQLRPYYKPEELDRECESIITKFLKDLHGEVLFPVDTEDLKTLIERDAHDLDTYADLSCYGSDVEGVTEFVRGRKPSVSISAALTEDAKRENRLRTTLTHEYGHVHFHSYLWETEPPPADLLRKNPNADKVICKRDSMIDAVQTDWMEWQAGYVCGAILMPKSALVRLCKDFVEAKGIFGQVSIQTADGRFLVDQVITQFRVSEDAAKVRLTKLNLLSSAAPTKSLFG